METKQLAKILKEQEKNRKEFLDAALQKQKGIISQDFEEIQKAIALEEKLLRKINSTEKIRNEFIKEMSIKYSLELNSSSLSGIIKIYETKQDPNLDVFVKLQKTLKNLIDKIWQVNWQNRVLIDNARNFIKETIHALNHSNKKPLLDRKI